MKKILMAAALAFALTACSSVNTAYFTLPNSQFELPEGQGNEVALQVILAEPLANGGLVYQTDPLHLNFAKQNLWAAPLDQSIAANLANGLSVPAAVAAAKRYITVAIEHALPIGQGVGPTHHFYELYKKAGMDQD